MRITLAIFSVLLMFTLSAPQAEAKKFGGGSSVGKSFSLPKKSQPASAPSQKQAEQPASGAAVNNTAGSRKGGLMGGMLGGLLAGGLLGALFFGGAFDGIQFMDILLLALVGFVIFKLVKGMKKPAPPQPAYAGPQTTDNNYHREAAPEPQAEKSFNAMPGSFSGLAEEELNLPDWFNKKQFLDGACSHFERLQAAWDEKDWSEISTYTSEALLNELKAERERHPDQQKTEVVSVMAELVRFESEDGQDQVSVNFYGWIREEAGEPREFNEYWHLSRDSVQEGANWVIEGIQQP